MMAEMMAALLAVSLAMAALGGVARLAAVTQSSHQHSLDRLKELHRLEGLLSKATAQSTPGAGGERFIVAANAVAYSCGEAAERLCGLAVETGQITFRVDGRLIASAPLPSGAVQLRAEMTPGPYGQPPRLAGAVYLLMSGEARPNLLAGSRRRPDVPVNCAYDPEGFACRLPPPESLGGRP